MNNNAVNDPVQPFFSYLIQAILHLFQTIADSVNYIPENQVFVLQFATGEFDLVTFDSKNIRFNLYEIKHSIEMAQYQYRHLVDSTKLEQTEKQYGKICERVVIYNGESSNPDCI